MNRQLWIVVIGLASFGVAQAAEEIELFRASKAGDKAWVWDSAQAKLVDGKLLLRLKDGAGESGNAYVADRFPYFPNARVAVAVAEVRKGDYTIQILGFSNNQHVAHANLVANSTETGKRQFELKTAGLAPGIDQVMLKVWVGGASDAAVVLDELAFTLPLDGFVAEMDERFEHLSLWDNESLVVTNSETGPVISLKPGTSYGSIRCLHRIKKSDGMTVLFNIARAESADATLQVVAFDKDGTYLKSLDALKNIREGWHSTSLNLPGLPPETAEFEFKLWVGGAASATMRLGRLLVIRPTQ